MTVITIKLDAGYAQKSFDIGNMGESALVSHLKGIKHRQLEKSQTGSSVSTINIFKITVFSIKERYTHTITYSITYSTC